MPLFSKKRGGYNLNSCDFYVISVQLLDGSVLQCTLRLLSTGDDCMNYIRQKLDLQQNRYFGLRYKCAQTVYRWVNLRKPLKKQIMKYACEFKLYFSVMFYTAYPDSLSNDSERYYYYLQMKSDILNGRLLGTPEKSILCASYSLQAEFGDFDPAKQNEDLLKTFTLLPMHMTKSAQILECIVRQALRGHEQLKCMSQANAELAYIQEARNFDGYGEEYFSAHDEDGTQFFVGYCPNGVIVKRIQSSPVVHMWKEIKSIFAHKKRLCVDISEINRISFKMDDASSAEYAAFVFSSQLNFYQKFDSILNNSKISSVVTGKDYFISSSDKYSPVSSHSNLQPTNNIVPKVSSPNICSDTGHFSAIRDNASSSNDLPACAAFQGDAGGCQVYRSKADMSRLLPPYRPAPDYDTVMRSQSVAFIRNITPEQHDAVCCSGRTSDAQHAPDGPPAGHGLAKSSASLPYLHTTANGRLADNNERRVSASVVCFGKEGVDTATSNVITSHGNDFKQRRASDYTTFNCLNGLNHLSVANQHDNMTEHRFEAVVSNQHQNVDTRVKLTEAKDQSFVVEFESIPVLGSHIQFCEPECHTMFIAGTPFSFFVIHTPNEASEIDCLWNLIWNNECQMIVAFDRSLPYLKSNEHYDVLVTSNEQHSHYEFSTLVVSRQFQQTTLADKRFLQHVCYTHLASFDMDSAPGFAEFCNAVYSTQNDTRRKVSDIKSRSSPVQKRTLSLPVKSHLSPPIVVHCRTGQDWSGVFLLIFLLVKSREQNEALTAPEALCKLRQLTQINLVPNIDEYSFSCSSFRYFSQKWRLV